MRSLCLAAALALVLAGCGSDEKKPASQGTASDGIHAGGLLDSEQVARQLGDKLKTLALKEEKPTIRVERPRNMTSKSLDTGPLEEELKKALLDSGKFAVLARVDPDAPAPADAPRAEYLLTTKVSSETMRSSSETVENVLYSLEITKLSSREIVLTSKTAIRKVTSK